MPYVINSNALMHDIVKKALYPLTIPCVGQNVFASI